MKLTKNKENLINLVVIEILIFRQITRSTLYNKIINIFPLIIYGTIRSSLTL